MKIFLSYASQDREPAQAIYLALRDQGHKVFFDRADLPAGEEFHNRIRAAIEDSQLFLFLISPNAIDAGSYTLTELDIAEKANVRWLPVALGKLDVGQLPAALKAVTFLESDGNLPAAVAAEVHRIASAARRKRIKYLAAAAAALVVVMFGWVFYKMNGQSKNEIVGKDGAPAVLIPSGTFIMGNDEDSPRREIFVDAFYLDKYEVTVARYAAFSKASGNVKKAAQQATIFIPRTYSKNNQLGLAKQVPASIKPSSAPELSQPQPPVRRPSRPAPQATTTAVGAFPSPSAPFRLLATSGRSCIMRQTRVDVNNPLQRVIF